MVFLPSGTAVKGRLWSSVPNLRASDPNQRALQWDGHIQTSEGGWDTCRAAPESWSPLKTSHSVCLKHEASFYSKNTFCSTGTNSFLRSFPLTRLLKP